MEAHVTSRSLQLWRSDEHHRDAKEAVTFDSFAAFRAVRNQTPPASVGPGDSSDRD